MHIRLVTELVYLGLNKEALVGPLCVCVCVCVQSMESACVVMTTLCLCNDFVMG